MQAASAPDDLFDRYVATGVAVWADAFAVVADPTGGLPQILIEDWDCPEDVAAYVGERIPEVRLKLCLGALEPFGEPPSIAPDALVELMEARYHVIRARADGPERALIDQLIAATRLYDSRETVQDLLDFVVRLRSFAPFNAMLLHIQKPGLTHAATARDWWERFRRVPKRGARPLLVLRTMGPVDFVFDILDTEGEPVPEEAFAFPTLGDLTETRFDMIVRAVAGKGISVLPMDAGDAHAGWIEVAARSTSPKGKHRYQLAFNRNHPPPTSFVTVAHELAHLFLGHLGADPGRGVLDRHKMPLGMREIEAETVAYLVAKRNGIAPRSDTYLASFGGAHADLDLHVVTRAANAVETAMGLSAQTLWNEKGRRGGLDV